AADSSSRRRVAVAVAVARVCVYISKNDDNTIAATVARVQNIAKECANNKVYSADHKTIVERLAASGKSLNVFDCVY
ncbi:unnamed protein product, partial [Ceratitis capitata]